MSSWAGAYPLKIFAVCATIKKMLMYNSQNNIYIVTLQGAKVYLGVVGEQTGALCSRARNDYVQQTGDKSLQHRRYAVWKLLEQALCDVYGRQEWQFYADANGKWHCTDKDVHFSLSHGDKIVAVALCDRSVGVDVAEISRFAPFEGDDRFAQRICTNRELALPRLRERETLARLWASKEAIFKANGDRAFVPDSVETIGASCETLSLTLWNEQIVLAVAH